MGFIVGKYYQVNSKDVDTYDLGVKNRYLAVGWDVLQLPLSMGWESSDYGEPNGKYGYLYLDPECFHQVGNILVGGE